MRITEIRIKLIDDPEDRLKGFCSVTFDFCFVVRDIKIINGNSGLFIAMPSRKLSAHCARCRGKNHLKARFCNQCGARLPAERFDPHPHEKIKLYADIAHPINQRCRDDLQRKIMAEYQMELQRSQEPGYFSRYDDEYEGPEAMLGGLDEDTGAHSARHDTSHDLSADADTRVGPPAPHVKPGHSQRAKPHPPNSRDARRNDR